MCPTMCNNHCMNINIRLSSNHGLITKQEWIESILESREQRLYRGMNQGSKCIKNIRNLKFGGWIKYTKPL